ncbi:hypothetical protein [Hafnia phage yong3]|nr:hypothetical protein [Hafnia phage yong3]
MLNKFSHLIPEPLKAKVQDKTTHLLVDNHVAITDSEEIAIAILDSSKDDVMVVVQHSSDRYLIYTNCFGLGEGNSVHAKLLIREFLDC